MNRQKVFIGTGWLLYLQQILTETKSKKPMLVCGKHVLQQKELLDFVNNSPCRFTIFTDFLPNPQYSSAIGAASDLQKQQCDFILAVGGGSAIDVAKCARRFSGMELTKDCLLQIPQNNTIKMAAIPTTAGSGSEATHFAVLYKDSQKYSVSGDDILPDYAVLNPEFLEGLPLYQKKSGFLDALCQAVESWWSLNANEESIAYSQKAITLLLNNYQNYFSLHKKDTGCSCAKETYKDILLGAHYAGKAINITTTTAAHAMSYGITKKFGLAHGHAVALCMVQVWQDLLEQTDQGLVQCLNDINQVFGGAEKEDALEKFKFMLNEMKLATPQNVSKDDLRQLAETVNVQRLGNHPVYLDNSKLYRMYEDIFQREEA